MELTGATYERSSVIALYTAPRTALEPVAPFHQRVVPERQDRSELGQRYGAVSPVFRIKK